MIKVVIIIIIIIIIIIFIIIITILLLCFNSCFVDTFFYNSWMKSLSRCDWKSRALWNLINQCWVFSFNVVWQTWSKVQRFLREWKS